MTGAQPPRRKGKQTTIPPCPQVELDRRRPGQSRIVTPRNEPDACEILSGMVDGVTMGSPIAITVRNTNQRSQDYGEMEVAYRPSHADATYDFKYGIRAIAGGGRSSARETIGRVAAGAVAKKLLATVAGCEVLAFVSKVRPLPPRRAVATRAAAHAAQTLKQRPRKAVHARASLRIQAI